jgi:cold shock CspA family protein
MQQPESSEVKENSPPRRYMGQVKWFNNKAGYGFITTSLEGSNTNDIFAHYTTIQVNNTQYKYLVQGEYVEFSLSTSVSDTHEFQATQITGMNNGRLMCETRQISRRLPREDDSEPPRGPSPVKRIQKSRPPQKDIPKAPRAPTVIPVKSSDGFESVTRGKVLKKVKKQV